MAELAVLTVVARQCQRAGACSLHIDAIAALAGWVPVVVDRLTGEGRMAQIFVARRLEFHLRARQALPNWIDAHVRALAAIGGVPPRHTARQWSGFFLSFKCLTRATKGRCSRFFAHSIASENAVGVVLDDIALDGSSGLPFGRAST
jgi:hypothetical protein